jgi:hypothetical protein
LAFLGRARCGLAGTLRDSAIDAFAVDLERHEAVEAMQALLPAT